MRKQVLQMTTALASVLALSGMAMAGAFGTPGYVSIEGLYIQQEDLDAVDFTTSSSSSGEIGSHDFDIGATGGARLTIEDDFGGQRFQLQGFAIVTDETDILVSGLDPVSSTNTNTTYDNFAGNDITDGDPNANELDAFYSRFESQLYSGELSWVHSLTNNVDLLVGVRYLHFGEEMKTNAFDEPSDFSSPGSWDGIDYSWLRVRNDIVGLQLGLQADWEISNGVHLGGNLKGGLGANFVSRDRELLVLDNPVDNFADSHDDTSFAQWVEFNPQLAFDLNDDVSLVIGGTLLWINEVSEVVHHFETAADQDDGNLRDDGDAFFYGASVGLKIALN